MDEIKKLSEALRGLAEGAETAVGSVEDAQSTWGWHLPPLSAKEIGDYARAVADQLDTIDSSKLNPKYSTAYLITKIDKFKSNVFPNFSGDPENGMKAYFHFVDWIHGYFSPYYEGRIDWQTVAEQGRLPRQFANRLRSIQKMIDRVEARAGELDSHVAAIESAYETAMNLPTDAEEMRATKTEIEKLRREAEAERAQIALSAVKTQDLLDEIVDREVEATKLVENTHDAYRAATTRGLGEAFQTRADGLSRSVIWWVGGLVVALCVGAGIGYHRVTTLQSLLETDASTRAIWLNLTLSFLSLAAPIWFAWIATKQIGHRFRLSEDYAFKASVAKAYEGYRREAARLDEDFVKRLFGSILDRLDEAPIRFVEHETPGTPWHDFFGRRSSGSETGVYQEPPKARKISDEPTPEAEKEISKVPTLDDAENEKPTS